jgi:DNA-binding response OmpR family regulator
MRIDSGDAPATLGLNPRPRSPILRAMLPNTLALIDDDLPYTDGLSRHLRGLGIEVTTYADSADLLASAQPYSHDFYVTDLMLPSVDGIDLMNVLRRRTSAGILVVSGRLGADTFKQVIQAGADMYLAKPVQFEQVAVAIEAVQRRAGVAGLVQQTWHLDRRLGQLLAPDGARVDLSARDRALLECFVESNGDVVPRETLLVRLGGAPDPESSGGLNGTVFRLRRRIERATSAAVPLQAKSGIGYAFRAPLKAI